MWLPSAMRFPSCPRSINFVEFLRDSIERMRQKLTTLLLWGDFGGMPAAKRFFDKGMRHNDVPAIVTMDKRGANKAAIDEINDDRNISIMGRLVKYLNNRIDQDHRAGKRVTRAMLGFKSFNSARSVLVGIELMQ
jgi:hypothetical protein